MSGDVSIDARIEIYQNQGDWWMTITGELFGPYDTDEEAIDAIPGALRSIE